MILAFPLHNETELAIDFAHSKFIGIVDATTGDRKIMPVGDTLTSEKGIFESLFQNKLNLVISPFYSFMSLRVFKENKVETYKAKGKSLNDNIMLYQSGKMKPFDIYESLLTGECAKDCVSCAPDEDCEH